MIRSRRRSLYCSPAEWAEITERAQAAGMSNSAFLMACAFAEDGDAPDTVLALNREERGLTVELLREEGVRPRLVLDDAEQREMRDRIAAVAERVSTGSGEGDGSELLRLRRMVSFLVRAVMTDMVREGRTRRMTALLADLFGEEEAVRIAERFVARIRKDGSP